MKLGKMHGMGHGHFGGHQFIREVFEQLNLTDEQKKKFEALKKGAKKEKLKAAIGFIFGKTNYETMFDLFIKKIEEAEQILTNGQKAQLREIMIEKHREFFGQHIFMMKDNIKELIEYLELTEEQKEKVEMLLTQAVESEDFEEVFKLKDELKNTLTEEQIEKAHEYILQNTPLSKIFEELEISDKQKEKFKQMHESVCSTKLETMKKFKAGEISFADIARKKAYMFKEAKSILTEEQIKKIKKMHKGHCHGHRHHGHRHGHGEFC